MYRWGLLVERKKEDGIYIIMLTQSLIQPDKLTLFRVSKIKVGKVIIKEEIIKIKIFF